MEITKTGHYHGDIGDAYAFEIEGMDQSDSFYILKSKAAKHIGTTSQPPTYEGGTQSFIALDDEGTARAFFSCVCEQFYSLVVPAVKMYGPGWFEVTFTNYEFQGLIAGKFNYVGTVNWPRSYNSVSVGASVRHDGNGYSFLFNHGPLFR